MGMSMNSFFQKGVLVDITVHKWLAQRKLTEEDLGLEKGSLSKNYKLGSKLLIPKDIIDRFSRLDNDARLLLYKCSFRFPFGDARYVPKKSFADFDNDFKAIKKEFDKATANLIENYGRYSLEMRDQFLAAAKHAYVILQRTDGPGLYVKDKEGNLTDEKKTEYQYINEFLERINQSYPTKEKITKRFSMDYVAFQMELPDLVEAGLEDVTNQNEQMKIREEGFKIRMMQELESYAEEIIKENRKRLEEITTSIKDRFKEGCKFTKPGRRRVLDAIKYFKRLNVSNDIIIEEQINKLEKIIKPRTAANIQDNVDIQKEIIEIVNKIQTATKKEQEVNALVDAYKQKMNI